jgi:hypothetical protein
MPGVARSKPTRGPATVPMSRGLGAGLLAEHHAQSTALKGVGQGQPWFGGDEQVEVQ